MHPPTENRIIITGAMGSGKSTLLRSLRALGYECVDEPARQIIAEQRSINGCGIWDRDPRLFVELMLSRALFQFELRAGSAKPIFFDRGIPDNLVYAAGFGFEFEAGWNAARRYRAHNTVFFTPAWEEIYAQDDERTMSFAAAKQFGEDLREVYLTLGYSVVEVPRAEPVERARFVVNHVQRGVLAG